MSFLETLLAQFSEYLPVFMRVSSFLLAIPIFGRGVPSLNKVGLAGLLTLLLTPVVPTSGLPQDLAGYGFVVVEEIAVGLGMGLMVTLMITALYLAGQLMDVPIGFGMVNVIDPQTGAQIPILAQFQFILAVLVFFIIDGHHALFQALAQSFRVLPLGGATMNGAVVEVAVQTFGAMFTLALRIGLPLMGALFLTDIALGIVARAVPQINVFFVGFPVKIVLGLAMLVLVLPVYVAVVAFAFGPSGDMIGSLEALARAFRGAP